MNSSMFHVHYIIYSRNDVFNVDYPLEKVLKLLYIVNRNNLLHMS